jgi:hypothetical protein
LGLVAVFGAAALMAACGDDENPTGGVNAGTAGTSGGSGGSTAGSTTGGSSSGTVGAGTGGTGGGAAGTAGTGGATAGSGGATAGTAGTGGVPHVIVPTVFIIDNVRLQLKGPDSGSGGEGGAGGEASGGGAGEGSVGGAGGVDAGGAGGAGGATEGGAGPGPSAAFVMPFDTAVAPLAINSNGFSPSVGGDTAGPAIFDQTTLTFDAAAGKPGGAAKISVPFSVAKQQADFSAPFAAPQDLTGYELLADVKVTSFGDAGTCPTAWLYVWGGGYANDKSAEPAMGQTKQLVKDEWTTVRLDLDGPYGYHSTANHPNFTPTAVIQWGVQMNTFGCP